MVLRLALAATLTLGLLAITLTPCYGADKPGKGILVLPLLHPRYPVKDVYEVLKGSDSPAFGFVYRAFGSSAKNLNRLLSLLTDNQNPSTTPITVVVYGDCGPCRQPRRPQGLFPLVLPNLSIAQLNNNLERKNRATLKALTKEFKTLEAKLPIIQGVRYIFMPSLEDNFTYASYRAVLAVGRNVFSARPDVLIGRNSLTQRQPGVLNEAHSMNMNVLETLKAGDVVTGDGEVLCLPNQRCTGYSLSDAKRWVKRAIKKGVTVLVWLPETQGLPPNTPGYVRVLKGPNQRTYTIPGIKYLKQLMR